MLKWLFLTLALMPLLIRTGWQQEADIPPQIIEQYPLHGIELAPHEAFTVTFNQAMNEASVEGALEFRPFIQGQFTWENSQVMHFRPAQWAQGTTYRGVIRTTAQAANGLALEQPYQIEFQTSQPLRAGNVGPAPEAIDVAVDAQIIVPFNRPVVPLMTTGDLASLPSPITIEPAISGRGEWINTSMYMFTPEAPLPGGTRYTVTIPAGLASLDGTFLPEDFTWSFQTVAPRILEFLPLHQPYAQLRLDRSIELRFNQPMDQASTEQAFLIFPESEPQKPIRGNFTWNDENTALIFQPDERLQINTWYTVQIGATARNAILETALLEPFQQNFYTVPLPGVNRWNQSNSYVMLEFASEMNFETLRDRIVITPEPQEWYPDASWSNTQINVYFAMHPATTYTVTVLAGVEDIYGNAMAEDFSFSYTTNSFSIRNDAQVGNGYNSLTLLDAERPGEIRIRYSGETEVAFRLYRLDAPDIGTPQRGNYYQHLPQPVQGELIRQWGRVFHARESDWHIDTMYLTEQAAALPPGYYELHYEVATGTAEPTSIDTGRLPIAVVNTNLTFKRTPDEVLIWVTDMLSAEPLAHLPITLYFRDQVIAEGVSDADGIVRFPLDYLPTVDPLDAAKPLSNWNIWAIGQDETRFGYWQSNTTPDDTARTEFLYTDRAIYRPGETVYFRGVIRERTDASYTLPALEQVHLTATLYNGDYTMLFEQDVAISAFGTYSSEFALPLDVPLGYVQLRTSFTADEHIYYEDLTSFLIEEFRSPEYYATVTPVQSEVVWGEPLVATLEAAYYAGGAVGGASLYWSAIGNPVYFPYQGEGRYRFLPYDAELDNHWQESDDESTLLTDSQGRYQIVLDLDEEELQRPTLFEIEGTVRDESGQPVTARNTILLHPADVYVGLQASRYFASENQPATIQGITVNHASAPVDRQLIHLQAIEIRWTREPIINRYGFYEWQYEEIEVDQAEVYSQPDGTFTYTFTPARSGVYEVRAETFDAAGRRNSSHLTVWVRGEDTVQWGQQKNHTVTMIADQDSYQPGETAQVIIPIPFTDAGATSLLISVERAHLFSYEVRQIEPGTDSLTLDIPITEAHAPNVYVSVVMFQGRSNEDPFPDHRRGQIMLPVQPSHQLLNVAITPSATTFAPGTEAVFDIFITDNQGQPVPDTEIGVNLTDRAVLDLVTFYDRYGAGCMTPPTLAPLDDPVSPITTAFYNPYPDIVDTDYAMRLLEGTNRTEAEVSGGGCGGGGEGSATPTVRTNFKTTPLWEAHLVTDANGHVQARVQLPDNLTRWRLNVVAVTADTQVGQSKIEIVSTLPLRVRPVTPRFFVVGDQVDVGAVINNATDHAQRVEVSLQAEGVLVEGENPQFVTLEPQSRQLVTWRVTVEDVAGIDLTFSAVSDRGYSDASKPMLATGEGQLIPVYRYTAPETVGTAGFLAEAGTQLEGISLPERFDAANSTLTLELNPSLAAPIVDALTFLKTYPHNCLEQVVSRFLPNIATYRLLQTLDMDHPELHNGLEANLTTALHMIYTARNQDGGWGWFAGMSSDPLVTAYVMLGLTEAQTAGFTISESIYTSGAYQLDASITAPDLYTTRQELNRQAFYLYVLARSGQVELSQLEAVLAYREKMSYEGRAYLLMAYQEDHAAAPAVNTLLSDLTNGVIVSATGAHWEEPERQNWGSDTRTTALALRAILRSQPDHALLPNVVRWLIIAQQGDHWLTTQENTWAILALTDWMAHTGELTGHYTYTVDLNGDQVRESQISPENITAEETLHLEVSTLLRDELNRLLISRGMGEGVLYYAAYLSLQLPLADVQPISRGVTVSREYFLSSDLTTPVPSAQVGDTVLVRLTVTAPQDIYFFVLEDPLPAGLESLNPRLANASDLATLRFVLDEDYDPRWNWGNWYFDHTEQRDMQTNLYADFLPNGTYVYTYLAQVTTTGVFNVLPTQAYAFYQPDIFGRTDGMTFSVLPEASQ